jgi:hypothetical protein
VELQDGSQALVEFDNDDDLIVMLGDGVNQYINAQLPADQALRALPHALTLPVHSESEARVWYGRMVLPPSSAIHPQHGRTFGELREALINASTSEGAAEGQIMDVLSLGCSQESSIARQLERSSCQSGTTYCWHRCMSLSQYKVSSKVCKKKGKKLRCVDSSGKVWDGKTHGDHRPGCK